MGVEQTVRDVFAAFSARDVVAFQALATPDVELHLTGTAQRVGRTGPYVGHAGVQEYFDDVTSAWRALELEPSDLRYAGEGVIAFGTARGTTADGQAVDVPVIWVVKLRDGLVRSVRAVPTAAEAQREAGR